MLAPNESLQPLNPDVYPNHLSPEEAYAIQFRTDITFMVMGAILWDMLTYFHTDVGILRQARFTFVKVCFVLSRLSAAGYILVLAIVYEDDIPHWTYILSTCLCLLSIVTSSYLFLQRILAIYGGYPRIKGSFCILWAVASLSHLLVVFGGHDEAAPGTTRDKDSEFQPWVSVSAWCLLLFDSAVIIAVSYKILLTCSIFVENSGRRLSWYDFLTGRTLPEFSRAIFRGGVQYYLITVGMFLLAGLVVTLSSVPQIYKFSVSVPLMASMACRVFRNTKLFYSEDLVVETI